MPLQFIVTGSFAPPARMVVFGAIDFAAAVARVGAFLGYRVTVCDARTIFATPKRFPDAEDEGYRIEFSGNDAVWNDLAVHTFTTDDDGDDRPDGVISIGFAYDAITPLLEDVAGATGLHLSRQGETVDQVPLSGTSAAVNSLGACVSTLP